MRLNRAGREWVEACAVRSGFDVAGVAAVSAEGEKRFREWVEAGFAGEMEWLKRADERGELVRGDLRRSIPWAKSVVVCAVNYNSGQVRSVEPAGATQGWIARYAWSGQVGSSMERAGGDGKALTQSSQNEDAEFAEESFVTGSDYHDVLLEKLRVVERGVKEKFAGVETRCYVDTGPLLERGMAAKAGVGWIGKNTCVLNQGLGSWMLLGVVVTSLELCEEASVAEAADRCGSCTRCIEACPTDALMLPTAASPVRQMDATKCIAYLTIEKKGAIDVGLREGMGRQVFGCDICQDVCPWNRKAPVGKSSGMPVRKELVNPELEWLAEMDGVEFNKWFRGSPLERTRRKRVLRNVAIAMGNSGEREFVPRLEEWRRGEDEVLSEAAGWALEKLKAG